MNLYPHSRLTNKRLLCSPWRLPIFVDSTMSAFDSLWRLWVTSASAQEAALRCRLCLQVHDRSYQVYRRRIIQIISPKGWCRFTADAGAGAVVLHAHTIIAEGPFFHRLRWLCLPHDFSWPLLLFGQRLLHDFSWPVLLFGLAHASIC
jgi:hypothetical protein